MKIALLHVKGSTTQNRDSKFRKAERPIPTPNFVVFFTTEHHMDQYYDFDDARKWNVV